MTVEAFCLGSLDTNAFLVSDEASGRAWVFDCPDHPQALIASLHDHKLVLKGVFLTHAHVDHMAGLEDLRRAFPGVPVHQHPAEVTWLSDPVANLSSWMGAPVTAAPAEVLVDEGQTLHVGPWTAQVFHVPGHSPGSVAYWFENEGELFSGDVLFRSGVGRWDFPGSSREALRASLARLCTLPDDTRVRPGHGGSTTIGREKASNPYLRSDDPWRD